MEPILYIDVDTLLCARTTAGFNQRYPVSFKEALGDGIGGFRYSCDPPSDLVDVRCFEHRNGGTLVSIYEIQGCIPESLGLRTVAATRTESSLEDVVGVFGLIAYEVNRAFEENRTGWAHHAVSIDEVLHVSDDLAGAISAHMESRGGERDRSDYLVLTQESLPGEMREHRAALTCGGQALDWLSAQCIARSLLEGLPWYEWPNTARIDAAEDGYDPYGAGRYDKVIFLDIDGVLNDEGPGRDAGVYVDPQMAARLARVVEETGAQIVLSSSWKESYRRYELAGRSHERYVQEGGESIMASALDMLQGLLDENGLEIAGMTPHTSLSGSRARPCEIMEWLRRYWRTRAYVILEDDAFWTWGWLGPNVVTTQTPLGKDEYGIDRVARGMTDLHAERAVEILNGRR